MRGKGKLNIRHRVEIRITPAYAGKSDLTKDALHWYKGSPPPMRGKAVSMQSPPTRYRITPAYAGKSIKNALRFPAGWDHPRLCGEKLSDAVSSLLTLGSPPPMRGKVVSAFTTLVTVRITPAYAGKSHVPLLSVPVQSGSPPPMRGKANTANAIPENLRITPAYAGKRITNVIFFAVIWDHPRLCGEKCRCSRDRTVDIGSPPPMRGKVELIQSNTDGLRITPAYAGKSSREAIFFNPALGSPPPMRGKAVNDHVTFLHVGITPAYAGKSINQILY